jgi:hypothetical protein
MVAALHDLLTKWDPGNFMKLYDKRIVPGDRDGIMTALAATQKRLQAMFAELQNGKQMQPRKTLGTPGSLQYQHPISYHDQLLAPAHKYA